MAFDFTIRIQEHRLSDNSIVADVVLEGENGFVTFISTDPDHAAEFAGNLRVLIEAQSLNSVRIAT